MQTDFTHFSFLALGETADAGVSHVIMKKTQLIIPDINFSKPYSDLLSEYDSMKETPIPFTLEFKYKKFGVLVTKLNDCSQGTNLPEGFVPHSSFWLINSNNKIIGVSNIRHELSDQLKRDGGHIGYGVRPTERRNGYGATLLAKSLIKAKGIGLEEVLLTCNKENIASVKVILKNGGKFESEEFIDSRRITIQRYWVRL
jgi:predicted acetyltransferase